MDLNSGRAEDVLSAAVVTESAHHSSRPAIKKSSAACCGVFDESQNVTVEESEFRSNPRRNRHRKLMQQTLPNTFPLPESTMEHAIKSVDQKMAVTAIRNAADTVAAVSHGTSLAEIADKTVPHYEVTYSTTRPAQWEFKSNSKSSAGEAVSTHVVTKEVYPEVQRQYETHYSRDQAPSPQVSRVIHTSSANEYMTHTSTPVETVARTSTVTEVVKHHVGETRGETRNENSGREVLSSRIISSQPLNAHDSHSSHLIRVHHDSDHRAAYEHTHEHHLVPVVEQHENHQVQVEVANQTTTQHQTQTQTEQTVVEQTTFTEQQTTNVVEQGASVVVEQSIQPEPVVIVEQPEPVVVVEQPEPVVIVEQPEPVVVVEQPEPVVVVEQPMQLEPVTHVVTHVEENSPQLVELHSTVEEQTVHTESHTVHQQAEVVQANQPQPSAIVEASHTTQVASHVEVQHREVQQVETKQVVQGEVNVAHEVSAPTTYSSNVTLQKANSPSTLEHSHSFASSSAVVQTRYEAPRPSDGEHQIMMEQRVEPAVTVEKTTTTTTVEPLVLVDEQSKQQSHQWMNQMQQEEQQQKLQLHPQPQKSQLVGHGYTSSTTVHNHQTTAQSTTPTFQIKPESSSRITVSHQTSSAAQRVVPATTSMTVDRRVISSSNPLTTAVAVTSEQQQTQQVQTSTVVEERITEQVGTISLVETYGAENVGCDEMGEYLIKKIEVPTVETVTKEVRKVERKEQVIEKKVPVYQESVKTREKKEVRVNEIIKEVERVEEKVVYKPVKQMVDRPYEVVREVKVPKEVIKEVTVEEPGEVIQIPKYYVVDRPIEVPKYLDQRVPVVVAQSFCPIIVEADDAEETYVDVECRIISFAIQHENVYVPLAIQRPALFESMVTQHKAVSSIPQGQYNALLRQLNPDLDFDHAAELFQYHSGMENHALGEFFKTDKGGLYLQQGVGCLNVAMKEDRVVICTLNKTSVSAPQLITQHNVHLIPGHAMNVTASYASPAATAAVTANGSFNLNAIGFTNATTTTSTTATTINHSNYFSSSSKVNGGGGPVNASSTAFASSASKMQKFLVC